MGYLDTGTVCPFPMVWPSSTNFSTNASDCTLTYAERLGPDHDVFQAVLMTVSIGALLEMTRRLYMLKRYTERKNVKLWNFPTFPYFVACVCFSLFFALESIDVFAFRGWYPPELYYILDEFVASSVISIGIVLVDFWVRCARGIGRHKSGLNPREKYMLLFAMYFNFVGWLVIGVIDSARFELYEALKAFGAAFLLLFFMIRSGSAVHELRKTLIGSSNNASSSNVLSANDKDSHVRRMNQKAVKVLTRKYLQFSFIVVGAIIALIVDGFLSLHFDENFAWQWQVRFVDVYDPVQIVLKVLYLIAAVAELSFFHVPKDSTSEKGSTSNSSQKANSRTDPHTTFLGVISSTFHGWMGIGGKVGNVGISHDMRQDSAPDRQTALVADIGLGIYGSSVANDDSKSFQVASPSAVASDAARPE